MVANPYLIADPIFVFPSFPVREYSCSFVDKNVSYSIFDFHFQEPLADARGTAAATVRERLNTQAETALVLQL
jgi:hypothetical protein